jgi:hypothetical protein
MFVQGIAGRVKDADAMKRLMDRWLTEMRPSAQGWLGYTGGITDDGRFIFSVRFESQEAAQKLSSSPEQDAWWNELSKTIDGEADFIDAPDVTVYGDSSRLGSAGFVQMIRGQCRDLARLKELEKQFDERGGDLRPDVLGTVSAFSPDGRIQETFYFTSEAEAREGEKKDMPEDMQALMGEFLKLVEGVEWYDIRDPWMA